MREHHTLWGSRRSRSVDQHRDLFYGIGLHRLDGCAFVERTNTNLQQWAYSLALCAIARRVGRGLLRNT